MRWPSKYSMLRASPAQPVFRRRAARRLTVICYHGVENADAFSRQLDYLSRNVTPVSITDVEAAVLEGRALPPRATLLTFDDGERNILEVAAPMLSRRGIPGVAFVVTGLLDGDRPFWWREVEHLVATGGTTSVVPQDSPQSVIQALKTVPNRDRLLAIDELRASSPSAAPPYRHLRRDELHELEGLGVTVSSHTVTHPCLNRCTLDEIHDELAGCREIVSAAIGREDLYLAYPNGDWDDRVVRVAREAGFRLGFQLGGLGVDLNSQRQRPEPLALTRVAVDSGASVDRLAVLVSGHLPAALRQRDRLVRLQGGRHRVAIRKLAIRRAGSPGSSDGVD